MKALYRKYRPTKLMDVVGEDQVTKPLIQSLKDGKISHAYLFIGPRGTGKTSVARILAHAVNGFPYELEDSYLDIIEIDAASNTGVDNIRDLREKAIIAPSQGKYKVYIIDEIHMLSKSAANALLKTLEEPPEHVIFIMATTEANKVPITISSRTQLYNFRLADAETMANHLEEIAKKEKIPIERAAIEVIVRRGGGSFRDSLSLLDQISTLGGEKITEKAVCEALGLPEDEILSGLLSAYQSGATETIQKMLKDALNSGLTTENIASELLSRIIENPLPAYFPLLEALPKVTPPFPEAKLLLALLGGSTTPRGDTLATPVAMAPKAQKIAPEPRETRTAVPPRSEEKAAPRAPEEDFQPVAAAPSTGEFSWDNFVSKVAMFSEGTAKQLDNCEYELNGDTLHVYPRNSFVKRQLESPKAAKIISDHLAGIGLLIHEPGEKEPKNDETLSQISAIMGDIQELGGDSPF